MAFPLDCYRPQCISSFHVSFSEFDPTTGGTFALDSLDHPFAALFNFDVSRNFNTTNASSTHHMNYLWCRSVRYQRILNAEYIP